MARKPAARQVVSQDTRDRILDGMGAKVNEAKSRKGLQDGDIRLTVVMTGAQSQLLHDWSHTLRVPFRDVIVSALDLYIEERIRPAVSEGVLVERPSDEDLVPEEYVDLYGEAGTGASLRRYV